MRAGALSTHRGRVKFTASKVMPKAPVYKVVALPTRTSRVVYDTRFDRFLDTREIPPTRLALSSGRSRQHILRIRSGQLDPTVGVVRDLTAGCIAITGDLTISPEDLFEIAPDKTAISEARQRDEEQRRRPGRRRLAERGRRR